MAVLIPSIGSVTFASGGERRFAERLEDKLEDDYLCWYDVALGPANGHPDFVVFHPRRGLLVLEVKDWKRDTIDSANRHEFVIRTQRGEVSAPNPLEQARHYAEAAADVLKADPQLVFSSGREAGKLLFPWGYGVVFPNLTRKAFEDGGLGEVIHPGRVICKDEMTEGVDAEEFQQRLWQMFPFRFHSTLSLPQIDRVRWHLFPEVRIAPRQTELFADEAPPPDLMRVLDLQQEQLARSLGDGHRVIHGVAGSGKTLILGYRAEHLAKMAVKPILVLCYNKSLARRLGRLMAEKGLDAKVQTHNFHQWCHAQLHAYHIEPPRLEDEDANFAAMVEYVIRGVERDQIPAGQYDAILIDEGHDFRPEWLKLVAQMVDPQTNSLLLLYDDAQSIYGDEKRKKFSFKSVGIQAAGRTTILKVNYRNTDEILRFARDVARGILTPAEADDDGVPLVTPQSAARHGEAPQVIRLPTAMDEAEFVVKRLQEAHRNGTPWHDMAVIYRDYHRDAKLIRNRLKGRGVPFAWHKAASYASDEDKVMLISMHSCKGLEFPLVVIPGQAASTQAELPPAEARLLYVAMTRATRELVVCGAQ